MLKTKITDMLDIEHPIVGGAMMWISRAEYVAAMSEAGGLGILASANYKSKESFAQAIDSMKTLTDNIKSQESILQSNSRTKPFHNSDCL